MCAPIFDFLNLTNLSLNLKKINIYICYNRYNDKILEEIINIKIPFNCSINLIIYDCTGFDTKKYKILQDYK